MKDSIRYLIIILIGFFFGIFVFLPINELTSYYEYKPDADISALQFINSQLWRAITLETPLKFFFYFVFGGLIGGISLFSLIEYRRQNKLIFQLRNELDKNLNFLINKGEDDNLEFKSSFRFDYRQQKVNKVLESVIIKSIAGFMNTQGGSLLIGVADDGTILGLDADYNTLSRKDSDGFTQLLMSKIAENIGTPACRLVRIIFHKLEGKEICRVIVLPSPLPIYVKDEKQTRFYIRTGSGTREMDLQEAIVFIKSKWG